jgi:VWFA-related protein
MLLRKYTVRLLLVSMFFATTAFAQQNSSSAPLDDRIYLDVVVTPKSGPPVTGLKQQDFTLLDNKVARPITSFQALERSKEPVSVIVVIDAVNTSYETVAYERGEIEKFLRAEGGVLAHPTALALFTDAGMQLQEGFTDDGNALSGALEQYVVGLRSIRRSAGFNGATERFQYSLTGLNELVAKEASRPGRKIIVWISPGWPLLSGPQVQLGDKQQLQLFDDIVNFSTQLRRARITLYSIDPLGTSDFGSRSVFYQEFVKGVAKPGQANLGNLSLQVLAIQSGGLVINFKNDISATLRECMADTSAYYEISFAPPTDTKQNEYHHLEIKLSNSSLTARTRQGYYAQPNVKELQNVQVVK